MALKKTIVLPNGVTTNYHKINFISFSDSNGEYPTEEKQPLRLDVSVISFLNEEYRKNCQAIETKFYNFIITQEEEESLSLRKLGYAKLRTLEAFADAEDC